MEYLCNKCGSVSEGSEWDKSTIEDLKMQVVYAEDLTSINEVDFDNFEKQFFYFRCPECLENCYVEDGHINKVG